MSFARSPRLSSWRISRSTSGVLWVLFPQESKNTKEWDTRLPSQSTRNTRQSLDRAPGDKVLNGFRDKKCWIHVQGSSLSADQPGLFSTLGRLDVGELSFLPRDRPILEDICVFLQFCALQSPVYLILSKLCRSFLDLRGGMFCCDVALLIL